MHTTVTTTTVLSITQTVEEWRAILADDSAFKSELRAKLAEIRANDDPRTNHITLTHEDAQILESSKKQSARVFANKIAQSAKKQNRKQAERAGNHFLGQTNEQAGEFACPDCDKTFRKEQFLNIHKTRMHKRPTNAEPQPIP